MDCEYCKGLLRAQEMSSVISQTTELTNFSQDTQLA